MTDTIQTPAHWPAGKVATEHGNYYEFGDERFISVTSAIRGVSKDGLVPWAALLAARGAMSRVPELVASLRTRPCGNSYNRCVSEHGRDSRCERCPCDACAECMLRWLSRRHHEESFRRSDEGTAIHQAIDTWLMRGGGPFPVSHERRELEPYLHSFAAMIESYGLNPDCWELGSATVINRKHGYAGTLDGGLILPNATGDEAKKLLERLAGAVPDTDGRILIDYKSREGEGRRLYPDQPLQLAAYREGEVIRLPDGSETPLPRFRHCAIVQIRPDGAEINPVVVNDRTFEAFLCAKRLFEWQIEEATAAISPRAFPAPKKAAARKATNRRPAAATRPGDTGTGIGGTPPRKATKKTTGTTSTTGESVLGRPSDTMAADDRFPY